MIYSLWEDLVIKKDCASALTFINILNGDILRIHFGFCTKEEVTWSVQEALGELGSLWNRDSSLMQTDLIVCQSLKCLTRSVNRLA